jgi:hypothetical protein
VTHVRLVARDNGLGLSRDIVLMRDTLQSLGCRVTVAPLGIDAEHRRWQLGRHGWRTRMRLRWHARQHGEQADLNLMFEHIWPHYLGRARRNAVLPNPEWFDARDVRHLPAIHRAWTKTVHGTDIFNRLGCPTSLIGFSSDDRLVSATLRERAFFHLAGGSGTKGSARLLQLWATQPHWPVLTVVTSRPIDAPAAANIRIVHGPLNEASLRDLQNRHRFHLCPSEAEGYGHYLAEAMSVGAVAITTDAAPMNELVTPGRGLLVRAHAGSRHGLAVLAHFDNQALIDAVETALATSATDAAALGQQARHWFETNRDGFAGRVATALAQTL